MDLNKMLDICRRCKYLPENELKQLCERICDILISESNVQPVRLSDTLNRIVEFLKIDKNWIISALKLNKIVVSILLYVEFGSLERHTPL